MISVPSRRHLPGGGANRQAEAYDVGAHLDADNRVVGFRLVNDEDEGYDLFTGPGRWACSCPGCGSDGDRGAVGCEHAAGLRAALATIGQLPPAPPQPGTTGRDRASQTGASPRWRGD